jgi:hypothetical protein
VKRTKQIIGIVLIIAAVSALVFWEMTGRDIVTTKKVLVASENIEAGEIVTKQMFKTMNIMPDTIISGALTPSDINKIEGKAALQDIVENQQIAEVYFGVPVEKITDKRTPYVIKSEWIDSRSSSLRKGDIVHIYNRNGTFHLGEFEVVFVKDVGDKEVIDISGDSGRVISNSDVRSRTNSSGIISHIEILAELEDYQNIVSYIDEFQEQLLIVQVASAEL